MTETTPKKRASQPPTTFSPVSLPKSPAALAGQQILTGIPRLVRDFAADLYNIIQKWNNHHINGAILVKNIAQLKTDSSKEFPDGLEEMIGTLRNIYKKLETLTKNIEALADRMKTLVQIKSNNNKVFSMTPEKISNIVAEIAKAYCCELARKDYVISNVAHSRTKDDAMFYVATWIHPQFVNDNIKVKLETLLLETGHRDIK